MEKNIELEYRTIVNVKNFNEIRDQFASKHKLVSETRRLSFMSFSKTEQKKLDFRVRVTNGNSEVVLKIGELHSDDRTEISQPITSDQFMGFARMLSHLSDKNYIAERTTYNYETEEGIVVSLVNAGEIAYIEFELLSNEGNLDANKKTLTQFIASYGFKILDEKGFDDLNHSLDDTDWKFADSEKDTAQLKKQLKAMI